jgi:SpoVK/Ycf46/Vps4 family AAA+-type ATPase
MNIVEEIEDLIRARYPILYVVSGEEARVDAALAGIAERLGKQVLEWSCTTGVVPAGTSLQSQKYRHAATRDPLAALDQVLDHVEPALFVFKDLHPFLTRNPPGVTRRLKEIARHLKDSLKTIILVAPVLELPAELEKEVTVVSFPLPTREELALLLDRVIREVRPSEHVTVELEEDGRERLLQAALGLTLGEAENVLARILVRHLRLGVEQVPEILLEKRQLIRKNGLLEYHATEDSFATVGGMAALKDWLAKRGAAFTPAARAYGLPAPKGLLLLGVQGCGKSLCAKAAANLWQVPLLRFDMGRMFGSLVGSSEENVRRAIGLAESVAPAVLWVDEIDKAFAGTQGSTFSDAGTTARVFGTFLTWLSEKTAPVFVVATANDISQLPPELLRKGRFDEIFFVDLPEPAERAEIFGIHLARRGRDPAGFDCAALAAASVDFSGAEIEEAVISGLYEGFSRGEELDTGHIRAVLQSAVPLARTMSEQVRRLREWASGRARPAGPLTWGQSPGHV